MSKHAPIPPPPGPDRKHAFPLKHGKQYSIAGVPEDLKNRANARVARDGHPSLRWVMLSLMTRYANGEVEP